MTGAKDPGFWSARVNLDLRIILHRAGENVVLCYVDSHDDAYLWAERRRLETHSTTGAAQLVELREVVQEVVVSVYVEAEQQAPPKPLPFARILRRATAGLWRAGGVARRRQGRHRGQRAGPSRPPAGGGGGGSAGVSRGRDPAAVPYCTCGWRPIQPPRRHAPVPHHEQHRGNWQPPSSTRGRGGPSSCTRTSRGSWKGTTTARPGCPGSAGTGKTVVALHRTAHLAIRSNPDARVLLTTFSDTLANQLRTKVGLLMNNEPEAFDRLKVQSLDAVGLSLYQAKFGAPELAERETVEELLKEAAVAEGTNFALTFLMSEWERVIDAWQLEAWDDYRDVRRIGRYRRLSEAQREALWPVFEQVRAGLLDRGLITWAEMFGRLTGELALRESCRFGTLSSTRPRTSVFPS